MTDDNPPLATGSVQQSVTSPDANRPWRVWFWSGVTGGAIACLLDTGVAIAGGIGGLSVGKAIRLVGLAACVLAAVGGVAGLLAALGARLARGRRAPEAAGAALAALVAAPLIARDAFALFAGPQAARVPGHAAISVGLAVVGTAAGYVAARLYGRLLARAPERTAAAGWLLFAAALGLTVANHWVLPRLYGWFHDTLSVGAFAACLLAARLRARPARARLAVVVTAAGVVAAGAIGAVLELRASQVMRYVAHERTAMTSLALRAVPAAMQPHAVAAPERRPDEAALPPLPAGPRRPEADVLVITIDALRADHVGAYGYRRPNGVGTTPNIDAIAAKGVRFARAYSQAPHTSFSVASMLTGKYFATLARLAPGEHHEPISAVMRQYGWKTAAFYPPAVFFIDAAKLKAYSDTNFDFEYVKFEYIDAQRRVDQLLGYYDQVRPKRSFVWVHFFEPHEPYVAHPEFPFGSGDVDRYDSEIAYVDAAVGRLVAEVRKRRPGTVVVIGADHGEEFDEHGGRYHGSTLYEEQLRIPLVISIPGLRPGVVDGQVQLIDVTPTLLNLLDIPVPVRMRGTDLGPWLATPPAPASRLPPAFAEVEDRRMVVSGSEKLLCDMRWGYCAYYDLAADPGEKKNLAEERPERVAAMRARLDDWLDGHVRYEPLLARGASNPEGGPVPRAIERGRIGDLLVAPELAALMTSDAPLSQRREAADLLVELPARRETAAALSRALADPDKVIGDWAAVGAARLKEPAALPRARALAADPGTDARVRVRAALALAAVGEPAGVAVLTAALDHCDDVLFCRSIVNALGKLGDRRAVPALLSHLVEVQNRREMVAALGDIGDPSAADALLERLRSDEYVPVRIEAARSVAKLHDPKLGPRLAEATRHETEPSVVEAARAAAEALQLATPPKPKTN